MSTVTIVDYGLGNLHSVAKGLEYAGAKVQVAEDGAALSRASAVVLPGVGAFADGMRGLDQRGHSDELRHLARKGVPLIGICLGAQLLLDGSEEFGFTQGLGIIPGQVRAIPSAGVKVPHVGWNRIQRTPAADASGPAVAGLADDSWCYFVHSFHMEPADPAHLLASTSYGDHEITAIVGREQVVGFQFHPEKSGSGGLALLARFIHSLT
jgi:glutamine amidotransferase